MKQVGNHPRLEDVPVLLTSTCFPDPDRSGFHTGSDQTAMDCSEYLEHASELLDGRVDEAMARKLEAHLSGCPRCRHHRQALEKSLALVHTLSTLEVPQDFGPRLSHRIFHLEDGSSIARESLGSGATTAAVLAMAVLLALVAWTPSMGGDGVTLELPPLVVAGPPSDTFTPRARPPSFSRGISLFSTADFQEGVWGDPHQLLFEYSSISERRRGQYLSRVGLQ